MKKYLIIAAATALMAVLPLLVSAQAFNPQQKLRVAQAIIEQYYVEDVDGDTITTEAYSSICSKTPCM